MFKKIIKNWLLPPAFYRLLIRCKTLLRKFIVTNYSKDYFIKNLNLKNANIGQRCFILGSGSSIKSQNLGRLIGEKVISVSNTFVHSDYSAIQPLYHVLPPLLNSHGQLNTESNFVEWLRDMETRTKKTSIFLHVGDRNLITGNNLFVEQKIYWVNYCNWDGDFDFPIDLANVPNIWSVSELAITIALYLGFEKIYLLGFDHDWFNGPLVYFYDHKQNHSLKPDENKLINEYGVDAEFQMRRHADIFRKYKYLYSIHRNIFNANSNPDHYLDVFPKVDFESLFEIKTEGK